VVVDISTKKGQEIIHDLTKISDVVIQNFKVEGLKKFKLDYESLKEINPGTFPSCACRANSIRDHLLLNFWIRSNWSTTTRARYIFSVSLSLSALPN
jgi:hypothetical protein